MFKGQITFDNLTLRYPPSVAQFLMEQIEKVGAGDAAANEDPVHDLLKEDLAETPLSAAG